MVIGEQLNQQQLQQQQLGASHHRLASAATAGSAASAAPHHHHRSSANSLIAQPHSQPQPLTGALCAAAVNLSTINGTNNTTSTNNNHLNNTGSNNANPGGSLYNHNNNNSNNNSNAINNNVHNNNNVSSTINVAGVGLIGGGTSATSAKNQLEQLNTMREALFSQDGWGCQHVNQDTNWEVPSSPEPTNKDPTGGPPMWKPNINNGTDLWESNLRNGGQPPPQPVQKTPWGHTPSSNLGGTWGEDDDGTDSAVWAGTSNSASGSGGVSVTGVGVGGTAISGAPQWPQNSGAGVPGGAAGGNTNASSSAKMGTIVAATGGSVSGNTCVGSGGAGINVAASGAGGVSAGTVSAGGNGWGDLRDIRGGGGPIVPLDMRNVDPREAMRVASSSGGGDPRDLRMLDPRDPIRGDPRGISGRLNGSSEMWNQHHNVAHAQMPLNKMVVGPGGNATANPVAVATVTGGGGGGIGASGAGGINVTGSGVGVNSQWGGGGTAQSVVGPKDIAAIAGKQANSGGWEEPSPPPQRRNIPNYDDGTSLWGGQQSRVPGGGAHWKDMSDPMNRSHLIRSAIGSQSAANANVIGGLGGVGSGVGGPGAPPPGAIGVGVSGNPNNPIGVLPQGRVGVVGPTVGAQLKPDNTMWLHANTSAGVGVGGGNTRNATSWGDDGSHGGVGWADDKSAAGIGQHSAGVASAGTVWNESSAVAAWTKNTAKLGSAGGGGWGSSVGSDGTDLVANDWGQHSGLVNSKSQPKLPAVGGIGGIGGIANINIEMLKNSKQYRVLVDSGYKKDDVERALISANMNIEEAADMLRANAANIAMDTWRRHDDSLVASYNDHSNATAGGGGGGFQSRYPTAGAPTIPFPTNNNLNNMANNVVGGGSGNNPGLTALNAMQPLHVQKYLNQGPHNVAPGGPQAVNTASAAVFGQAANVAAVNVVPPNSSGQPSAQQLRMLVQQIQLAVHSGYLSSQILNQPLAPATLLLLNQLLSNIKHLQGAQQSLTRGNNATNIQMNVAISKYKQQIQNLQNQINAQQGIYIKQQQQLQQSQHHIAAAAATTHVVNSNAEYLRGQHDALNALQSNFSEMNLTKPAGYQTTPNQQSRLNQWKLPVLDKDVNSDSTDFSRAPGATKQSLPPTNSNNMGPLGMQSDGTWSSGRNLGDGWPDHQSNDNENKDWCVAQPTPSAAAYSDLVQEFEPGKPWKGSQIKSIEDDPSITPGSVARSSLSINAAPKEADIFANTSKTSPTDLPPLSLSSTTWSFNPSTSNQNFPSSWSDNAQQCTTSELWATPMNKTSRGPPPGLGSNKACVNVASGVVSVTNQSGAAAACNSNGWMAGVSVGGVGVRGHNSGTGWSATKASWNSNWLLIKNLTAQIDGSTLRTLCMQHGPLKTFHVYLNQGIALCKYATREEASKAQMTLNNCVLGNTTICAESPSENEVQSILQHLPQIQNNLQQQQQQQQQQQAGITTPCGSANNCVSIGNNSNGGGSNNAGGCSIGNSGNNAGGSNSGPINTQGNTNNSCSSSVNNVNVISNATTNCGSNVANMGGGSGGVNVIAQNHQMAPPGSTNLNNNAAAVAASVAVGSNSANIGDASSNNGPAVWRQTQNQLQNLQNSRHTGRETDFDYISKYF